MKTLSAAILFLSAFIAACSGPPADQPKANTVGSAANNGTANPGGGGESLPITPANSAVTFVGYKVTGKHNGGFTMFGGEINLVNGKPEDSSVSVDIDTTSIFADDAKLTDHLKTADFFDVAKFPKATFKSTKITAGAKAPNNYTVTGDMDLHGVVKSIQFPAKIDVTDADVAVNIGFRFNRKDFGIAYAGKADDLIYDEVSLLIDVKAPRKK